MSSRRTFIEAMVTRLAAVKFPWCVLRNADQLYEDGASDVDLLTRPEHVLELQGILRSAGEAAGFRLVQKTRFVNHSLVY